MLPVGNNSPGCSGLIARSPARSISLPKAEHREMRFLSVDEISSLADTIEDRYQALVLTAAYTGLRAGELGALRVDRLNLLRRTLRVEEALSSVRGHLSVGPPKTPAARRTVGIPAFLCEILADHISRFPGEDDLVFSATEGGAIRWTNFRRRVWKPAVSDSIGEPCRFHDLRHSHAALLIAAEEHPKVIQARLGHASIRTTLDTYGHLAKGLDGAAADRLDQVFRSRDVVEKWSVGGAEVIPIAAQQQETPG